MAELSKKQFLWTASIRRRYLGLMLVQIRNEYLFNELVPLHSTRVRLVRFQSKLVKIRRHVNPDFSTSWLSSEGADHIRPLAFSPNMESVRTSVLRRSRSCARLCMC